MTSLILALQARLRTVVTLSFALLSVIAVASLLIDTQHAHTWAEQHIPCFWSLFGFAAAACIIGLTRWLGGSGIQARPDVYDRTMPHCEDDQ